MSKIGRLILHVFKLGLHSKILFGVNCSRCTARSADGHMNQKNNKSGVNLSEKKCTYIRTADT